MGTVNICLKRSYIGVVSLIAAFMILLLGLAIWASDENEVNEELDFIFTFSAITLILVVVGAFGAWNEQKWALVGFAAGMTLSCLYMLGLEISLQVLKPQVETILKSLYIDMLPLANTTAENLAFLNNIQSEYQCCGIQNYTDWEDDIPESCLCAENSINPCMADTNLVMDDQTIRIYAEPCLPLFIGMIVIIHATTVVSVGFMLLWVLSIGLCAAILCQMNKKWEIPHMVYRSAAKTEDYSRLIDDPDPHDG